MSLITLALRNEEEPKAKRVASRAKVSFASSCQLQYVSTARGTHLQPSSAHLGSLAVCFLFSAKDVNYYECEQLQDFCL